MAIVKKLPECACPGGLASTIGCGVSGALRANFQRRLPEGTPQDLERGGRTIVVRTTTDDPIPASSFLVGMKAS